MRVRLFRSVGHGWLALLATWLVVMGPAVFSPGAHLAGATSFIVYQGVLTDGSSQPVVGAQVTLSQTSGSFSSASVATGSDGSFSLSVTPGSYVFGVNDHQNRFISVGSRLAPISLTQNTTQNFSFPLTSAATVQVLDSGGNPDPGVEVTSAGGNGITVAETNPEGTAYTVQQPESPGDCTTDAGGQCSIDGPVGGQDTFGIAPVGSLTTTVKVAFTANGQTFPVQLPPTPVVFSGTITDGSGQPVADTNVRLSAENGSGSAEVMTDASGTFSLAVAAGMYELNAQVNSPGSSPLSNASIFSSNPLSLTQSVTENFSFPAFGSATVQVLDAGGNPVAGATVFPNDPSASAGATTADGTPYTATAEVTPFTCTTGNNGDCSFTSFNGASDSMEVEPPGATSTTVDVTFPLGGQVFPAQLPITGVTLSGTLTDGSGQPVSGLSVTLFSAPGAATPVTATATTATNGSFALNVAPGMYRLIIGDEDAGRTIRVDTSFSLTTNLTEDFSFAPVGSATLHVVGADGHPASGVETVGPGSFPFTTSTETNPQGLTYVSETPSNPANCVTDADGDCTYFGPVGGQTRLDVTPVGILNVAPFVTFAANGVTVLVSFTNFATVVSTGTQAGSVGIGTSAGTLSQITDTTAPPAGLPPGAVAVVGAVSYDVSGLNPGASTVVSLQLPAGSSPTNVLKYVNGTYTDVSSIATISGNTVTLHLTDGGLGDEDGVANGVIVDPVVPVQEPTSAPAVTMEPMSQTVGSGHSLTFTAAATGTPVPTVQWQYSLNGGSSWANLAGATSGTLTTGALNSLENGWQVRAVFTSSTGSANSNAATITLASSPVVTTQPTNETVTSGGALIFTTAASGTPTPTVQWQYSVNKGASWGALAGATLPTFTVGSLTAFENGWELRAVYTNAGGSATSKAATITVSPTPPSTAVLSPAAHATISGSPLLDASASSGVTKVVYEISGGSSNLNDDVVATATATLYGWLASWNTGGVPDGTYTLQSVASFAGGASGSSAGITVTVNN